MNNQLLDLYTDYLISSFSKVTATGLSSLVGGMVSHDQITRFLRLGEYSQQDFWLQIKPLVRHIETDEGIIVIDDTIEEKPYTDENDLICWHFDHTKGRNVKGVNIINFLYHNELEKDKDISIPLSFEVVLKTEIYDDPKTKKTKRRSPITKNEWVRQRLQILTQTNRVRYRYVVFDSWYSSKENLKFVKHELKKDVIAAIAVNRTVALSEEDKLAGRFVKISALNMTPETALQVYLKGLDFPVLLTQQVFTNEDGSRGVLYLISTDLNLSYQQLTTIYKKRWKVETFHQSLKQNVALEQSPTKTVTSQKNHIFAAMLGFVKLEQLKLCTNLNHFALKSKIYLKALQASFQELKTLKLQINPKAKLELTCQTAPI